MSHVIAVLGQADWIDLTTASVWQQSPIADSLMMQIASGGVVIVELLAATLPGDRRCNEEEYRVSERVERIGDSVIVYDDALLGQADAALFTPREQADGAPAADGVAGRGRPHFISVRGLPCVLRHYYRGGMARRLSADRFVWAGECRTRSFVEWRLLAELRRRDLPVPRPVAARYVRRGPSYTADLITERLADVTSLAALLEAGPQGEDTWRDIGATIARFHAECVFHADLNAHNIQVAVAGRVYLLDFDRGRLVVGEGAWQRRNLDRLRRSVDKVCRAASIPFDECGWAALLAGYDAGARPGQTSR